MRGEESGPYARRFALCGALARAAATGTESKLCRFVDKNCKLSHDGKGVLMCRQLGIALSNPISCWCDLSSRKLDVRGRVAAATWTAAKGHLMPSLPSVSGVRVAPVRRRGLRDDDLASVTYSSVTAVGPMSSAEHR